MAKKDKKLIKYTNRDFNSIKESLVEYAKRYYPDTFKDFSQASFGSLMLDTVAHVGDVLSFYLDYQTNETFLDTAIEYQNVLRLGEQVGYKQPLRANSFGVVALYILAPVEVNGSGPDVNYLPVLVRGSRFTSESGQIFTLIDDVNFASADNEIVTATETEPAGSPTSFAVKAYGRVISGELNEILHAVSAFQRFLEIPVADPNITEIVSVTDAEGHEYFEVEYLSQDTIFKSVVNKDPETRDRVPNVIVATIVPRRFVTSNDSGQITLKFGYGSESSLKTDNTTHPSNVILKMHGRDYETDLSLDPAKLLETDKFGIAPSNTTLRIIYRTNTEEDVNVASRGLNTIVEPLLSFSETATSTSKKVFVRDSIEVVNEDPILGDTSEPTLKELKQRVNDIFASQNRAVTIEDYEALIYRMPSKFGKIKRTKIIRDHDSFKRNLNLYLLSEGNDGNLVTCNQIMKRNAKTWINHYKMINDTIDILDPKIVNIGIKFVAVVDYSQDKFEALNTAITTIQDMFEEKLDIGQPIYITKIYDLLNNLDEIVDVANVEIVEREGSDYSSYSINLSEFVSADGRILYAPEDTIYELKYPDIDIKGTIK